MISNHDEPELSNSHPSPKLIYRVTSAFQGELIEETSLYRAPSSGEQRYWLDQILTLGDRVVPSRTTLTPELVRRLVPHLERILDGNG